MHQILDSTTAIKTVVSRQPRRRWGSYRSSIERRAAVAAIMIKDQGWRPKRAASLFDVCPTYVALARKLSDEDRERLYRGELKLAALHKDYCGHLAERRAHRLAAEHEAKAQALREANDARLDQLIARYGADRIMAALDRVTAPQRQAAE